MKSKWSVSTEIIILFSFPFWKWFLQQMVTWESVYTRANHFLFIYFSFPIALREMIPCRICYCLLGLTNQNRKFQTLRPIKCLLSNACVKNLAPSFTQFTHSNQRTSSAWLCMNCGYFNLIMLFVYGDYDLYYKGKVHFASPNHIFKVNLAMFCWSTYCSLNFLFMLKKLV